MRNVEVLAILDTCQDDLDRINAIIQHIGSSDSIVPYLTKYSLIKACGTIEIAYKAIIADYCSKYSKKQVKTFLTNKVRESSSNPSYSNICGILADFDDDWKSDFKEQIKNNPNFTRLQTSLKSLVDARNDFAHGGNPSVSFFDVVNYYKDSRKIIETLDDIVS